MTRHTVNTKKHYTGGAIFPGIYRSLAVHKIVVQPPVRFFEDTGVFLGE